MISDDLRKNAESYPDPTAYEALKNIETEEESRKRFESLLRTIFDACKLADFRIDGRLTLYDKKTGITYK